MRKFAFSLCGVVLGFSVTATFAQPTSDGVRSNEQRVLRFAAADRDGGGPTHVFAVGSNLVAIVDPFSGGVHVINAESGARAGVCALPADWRPWRLVRGGGVIRVVNEAETETIDVILQRIADPQPGCALSARPYAASTDAAVRLVRSIRTPALEIQVPTERSTIGRPLIIRSNDFELLGARELERTSENRHFIATKLAGPDDGSGKIRVSMHVLRFAGDGRLSGIITLQHDSWRKRGFDHVAILPNGHAVVMWGTKEAGFRIQTFRFGEMGVNRWNAAISTQAGIAVNQSIPTGASIGREEETGAVSEASDISTLGRRTPRQIAASAAAFVDADWTYERRGREVRTDGIHQVPFGNPPTLATWVQPLGTRRIENAASQIGVAYSYGGVDTPDSFRARVRRVLPGHIGDMLPGNACQTASDYPAGVDCSAFVWHAWGLRVCSPDRSINTSVIEQTGRHLGRCRVPNFGGLRPGDAINTVAFKHVVLVGEVEPYERSPDGVTRLVRVSEASSRCGAVCVSRYELERFHGWSMIRRANVTGSVCRW